MISRPDLIDQKSPDGIEVFQLTDAPELPSCHVYMEAQVFTPDSRRFILHRSANPHGSDRKDPNHRYQVCDIENNCELTDLTSELGTCGIGVAPDNQTVYYFVDETYPGGGKLTLKKVNIDGTNRETLLVIDSFLPGTRFKPSLVYSLSTISSDGRRIAISCHLGDGNYPSSPWGLLVFDLTTGEVTLPLVGPSWCNIHPQYSRSLDPEASHDILVQENHGTFTSKNTPGNYSYIISLGGIDIHVVRDDGMHFRNLAWGRDGFEVCQGHQCWVGREQWAITSTFECNEYRPDGLLYLTPEVNCRLIAGKPFPHIDHYGNSSGKAAQWLEPNGIPDAATVRSDLSRNIEKPRFVHFATDISGKKLISDGLNIRRQAPLYIGKLGEFGEPIQDFTYLLETNPLREGEDPLPASSNGHVHPFLSPDGKLAFYNSIESGTLQAYMVRLND